MEPSSHFYRNRNICMKLKVDNRLQTLREVDVFGVVHDGSHYTFIPFILFLSCCCCCCFSMKQEGTPDQSNNIICSVKSVPSTLRIITR